MRRHKRSSKSVRHASRVADELALHQARDDGSAPPDDRFASCFENELVDDFGYGPAGVGVPMASTPSRVPPSPPPVTAPVPVRTRSATSGRPQGGRRGLTFHELTSAIWACLPYYQPYATSRYRPGSGRSAARRDHHPHVHYRSQGLWAVEPKDQTDISRTHATEPEFRIWLRRRRPPEHG